MPVLRQMAIALGLILCLVQILPANQNAVRDSLITLGKTQHQARETKRAMEHLKAALEQDPEGIETLIAVGNAYFDIGQLDHAMRAYKDAMEINAASAPAQTGIARIHYRRAAGGFLAVRNARKAVSEARRATRMDPDYAPAYILLGKSYERLNENYSAALRAYAHALQLHPYDGETARLFGIAYIEHRRRSQGDRANPKYFLDETTLKNLEPHLNDHAFLYIAAQIYFDQGETQQALETFERYINALPEQEQTYYRDIGAIGTKREIQTYEQTPDTEKSEFLKQFWTRRDLDLLTEVNERLFEHYRRVWYALQHFGQGKKPWDVRGDIYIRYGDPDHRTRSGYAATQMTAAVEQVKERLALALYGPESIDETFIGPVYPVRSNQSFMGALDPSAIQRVDEGGNLLGNNIILDEADAAVEDAGEAGSAQQDALENFHQRQTRPDNIHHFRPVTTSGDMTIVPWESWVYTNVGEGIEITFTDEHSNGVYDYAPIPDFPEQDGSVGLHRYSQFAYFSPHTAATRAVLEIPDFYRPGGPMSGLGFSYDFADFRGSDGKTTVEVYYGIDPVEMGTFASGDTSTILADCAVVLTDTSYTQIYRSQDLLGFRALGHRKWPEGAFIPNILSVNIPPGEYLLTVQLNDRASERKGIYRHRVQVESYTDQNLHLSDIQLGYHISDTGRDKKFKKGDIYVVPMTTRAYREDQSAYMYYEVYNLTPNTFGETRYRITYTIGSENPKRPFNLLRSSVGALTGLFAREEKTQVKVSFDQVGNEPNTPGYLELSLKKVKPGYNRLTVTVEDLTSKQIAAKEILFRYKK